MLLLANVLNASDIGWSSQGLLTPLCVINSDYLASGNVSVFLCVSWSGEGRCVSRLVCKLDACHCVCGVLTMRALWFLVLYMCYV